MTIEEAIEHCKEVAKEKRYECAECTEVQDYRGAEECNDCAEEHEQLAEWLTELQQRRETDIIAKQKSNGDRIRKMTDEELAAEFPHDICSCVTGVDCREINLTCYDCCVAWLKQEVNTNDDKG